MNVTFLVGNGFDIGLGLKTRYSDFYEEYCKADKADSEAITKFKRTLREWQNNKSSFSKDEAVIQEMVKPTQNAESRTGYDRALTQQINESDMICRRLIQ